MKYMFKSKSKYNNKILGKILIITFILIIIFTFFLLSNFNKRANKTLEKISSEEIKRVTYYLVTNNITNEVLNKDSLNNILIINKNNNNEILYVDFNLDTAYKVLDDVSNLLTNSFKNIENGDISFSYYDHNLSHKTNGIVLNIPIGNVFNSTYFYNLGPKIPVKINFIGSILTNLETKVTNYGLNNALVEVFIYLKLTPAIIAPFHYKEFNLEYKTLIASMMIEGEVPSFYNGVIEKESNVISKKIT